MKPRRAYFTLHNSDIKSRTDEEIEQDFGAYSIFVAQPTITPERIARIRSIIPRSKYLAYDNCMDAPGPDWTDDYWTTKSALIGKLHFCWFEDSPAYILTEAQAMNLVEFHRQRTRLGDDQCSFDGIYLDICVNAIPPWRRNIMLKNGINEAAAEDLNLQFKAGRRLYTSMLAERLDTVIVGNTRGELIDPNLCGISIENIGGNPDRPLEWALGALAIQQKNARWPNEHGPNIFWIREKEFAHLAELLADAIPNVYAGTLRSTE